MIDKIYMIMIVRMDEEGNLHESIGAFYNLENPPSLPPIWMSHCKESLEQVLEIIKEEHPHHFKIAEFTRSN